MKNYLLSELVLDFDLYPRGSIDNHHVAEIATAVSAGSSMPPIVIEKVSKRIVDGFHRWKAYRRLYGEEHSTKCVEKTYPGDSQLLLDAMRFNASHGRALTQHDKTHCILLAQKLNISSKLVAEVLNLTSENIGKLKTGRIGTIGSQPLALKQTIRHMSGRKLTKRQALANDKLSGMNQTFYVNQLLTLLETDLIDTANTDLCSGLVRLQEAISDFLKKQAA